MKLNIIERILLSGILPAKGTFQTLKLLRVLKEDLSFTEEENKRLEFRQDGDRIHWKETAEEWDIKIGDTMKEIIVKTLKDIDEKGELTDQHFSLYEKFVETE
jgi:hypothetical protein